LLRKNKSYLNGSAALYGMLSKACGTRESAMCFNACLECLLTDILIQSLFFSMIFHLSQFFFAAATEFQLRNRSAKIKQQIISQTNSTEKRQVFIIINFSDDSRAS
jgi:hypothetical protein